MSVVVSFSTKGFSYILTPTAVCGVVVVSEEQKLEDLRNVDKCNICRSFAAALLLGLDRDLLPNDVMIVQF